MPNHFLTIGLCARDWELAESRGIDDPYSVDLSPLVGANLCEVASTLPDELQNITASTPPCRYRHKLTGEFWPDNDGPHGVGCREWDRVELTAEEVAELTAKYGAATWYEWQIANWGTKWGTYQTKVYELGGDGSPVLIEFQSAWRPPSPQVMRAITDYLRDTYYLTNIKWIGHEPYDHSTVDIEVAEPAAVA